MQPQNSISDSFSDCGNALIEARGWPETLGNPDRGKAKDRAGASREMLACAYLFE